MIDPFDEIMDILRFDVCVLKKLMDGDIF